MYLDTDVLLTLLKDKDWLKQYVDPKRVQGCTTSVLNLLEARLVLLREEGKVGDVLKKTKAMKIKMLPVDEEQLETSELLLHTHKNLGIFDSMHAAICLIKKEKIFSTDHIYDEIGLQRIDPRDDW